MASTRTASGREYDISQFGAVGQTVTRMSNLADDVIWNGAPKGILYSFSSQIASSAAHSGY